MAKLTWKVSKGATDLTSLVRSISYSIGRDNAVSAYGPNFLSFTMTNTNDGASLPDVQDEITVQVKTTAAFSTAFLGRVTQRIFNDGPGTALNSTCTIVIVDGLGPIGTLFATGFSAVNSLGVLNDINSDSFFGTISGTTDFRMYADEGVDAMGLANNVIAGDGGVLRVATYIKPSDFDTFVQTAFSFGPTTSATQIGYDTFSRSEGSSNGTFFTTATVTDRLTTSTADSANVTTYGQRFLTITSAENETSSNDDWYANVFSDPSTTTLFIGWSDIGQNSTALNLTPADFFVGNEFVQASYTPPGGSLESAYYWVERYTVDVSVRATNVAMVLTPASLYGRFILNSTVFGVLDTSRLGVS